MRPQRVVGSNKWTSGTSKGSLIMTLYDGYGGSVGFPCQSKSWESSSLQAHALIPINIGKRGRGGGRKKGKKEMKRKESKESEGGRGWEREKTVQTPSCLTLVFAFCCMLKPPSAPIQSQYVPHALCLPEICVPHWPFLRQHSCVHPGTHSSPAVHSIKYLKHTCCLCCSRLLFHYSIGLDHPWAFAGDTATFEGWSEESQQTTLVWGPPHTGKAEPSFCPRGLKCPVKRPV